MTAGDVLSRGWALAIVALGAAGLILAVAGGDRLAIAGGVVLVLAVATPICLRLRRDPLDAVGIYGLVSAVYFGLASLVWLGTPPLPPPGIARAEVAGSLVLVAAALAGFGAAARLTGSASRVPIVRIDRSAAPHLAVVVAVFAASIGASALGIGFSAFGYLSDAGSASERLLAVSEPLRQLSGVGALVVLACALVGIRTNDRRFLRALIVLVPLQVAAGFLLGFKVDSVTPIVFVALAYVATRGMVPWKVLAATAVVLALVLIPANKVYRTLVDPESQPPLTPAVTAEQSYEYLGSRLRVIDDVALIRDRTPSVFAYGSGDRYLLLPALIMIPRALWPDKPVLDFASEFGHAYWDTALGDPTGPPPTQIGDLYRNFQTAGAVIGLGIWGLVVGGFTALRRRWRSPRMEMVYLASLFTWVWNVEQDLPMLIAMMARTVPVTIIVAWLLLPGTDSPVGYRRILAWLGSGRGAKPRSRPVSP